MKNYVLFLILVFPFLLFSQESIPIKVNGYIEVNISFFNLKKARLAMKENYYYVGYRSNDEEMISVQNSKKENDLTEFKSIAGVLNWLDKQGFEFVSEIKPTNDSYPFPTWNFIFYRKL